MYNWPFTVIPIFITNTVQWLQMTIYNYLYIFITSFNNLRINDQLLCKLNILLFIPDRSSTCDLLWSNLRTCCRQHAFEKPFFLKILLYLKCPLYKPASWSSHEPNDLRNCVKSWRSLWDCPIACLGPSLSSPVQKRCNLQLAVLHTYRWMVQDWFYWSTFLLKTNGNHDAKLKGTWFGVTFPPNPVNEVTANVFSLRPSRTRKMFFATTEDFDPGIPRAPAVRCFPTEI